MTGASAGNDLVSSPGGEAPLYFPVAAWKFGMRIFCDLP